MIKFKILDTKTGLYSHGGYVPVWSERGKSWDSKKSVTFHLKTYRTLKNKIPESWVVVEFRVTFTETDRTPVKDLVGNVSYLPVAIHVSGKDICRTKRQNIKKQKSKSQKKIGKRSKD